MFSRNDAVRVVIPKDFDFDKELENPSLKYRANALYLLKTGTIERLIHDGALIWFHGERNTVFINLDYLAKAE